jgi:hypothetical protein
VELQEESPLVREDSVKKRDSPLSTSEKQGTLFFIVFSCVTVLCRYVLYNKLSVIIYTVCIVTQKSLPSYITSNVGKITFN